MSEINPLSSATYYAGIQNATNQASKENKKEKISSTEKSKFSKLLTTKQSELQESQFRGFPSEIQSMSVEDAAIYLKDIVDIAGDKLSEYTSTENIMEFKKAVQQFIRFVVNNNFEIHSKKLRGGRMPAQFFSKYNTKPTPKDPRITVELINEKLDNMVRGMLLNQDKNLKILAQANEIKGLIIDLLQA